MAEVRGQFGSPEEGDSPPLESVARRRVKRVAAADTSVCTSEM
jgi:hypothetical protein